MNAVVTDRAPLAFWPCVVHLLRFDLRRFRLLVAVIAGLEIARAAFVEWALHLAPVTIGERFGGAFGTEEVAFFDGLLLLATAITTAVIVQADLPSDDRAFWRTRPLSPVALAVAKLTLFVLLLVALPAAINAGRLAAYGAPASAIVAATLQILVGAGTTVAPLWALALATRTLPRFLGAIAVLLVGSVLAAGAFTYWMARGAGGIGIGSVGGGFGFEWQGGNHGPWAAAVVVAAVFAILIAHYRLRRRWAAVAAGLTLVVVAQLAPASRTTTAAPPELARLVDGRLRLPDGVSVPPSWPQQASVGWPVFLTGRIEIPPLAADVSAAVTLEDPRLVSAGRTILGRGMRQCCAGRGPMAVIATDVASNPAAAPYGPAVFGIPAADVEAVAGRRIAVDADATVAFARHRLAGVIPLRQGAAFRTDAYLLEVLGLEPARRALLIRFARFPSFAERDIEGLSLVIADPARTRVISTTPTWKVAPFDAASGGGRWAQGRTWSGRFHVLLTSLVVPSRDAELLIVETRPIGAAHTRLSATDVEVRAPRLE